jgi:HD-GYP domain-containing protein (c-di-GMP phosphodiesterase class II)
LACPQKMVWRRWRKSSPASTAPRTPQLSLSARILCVDQLDALSAERPYRRKLPTERVVAILHEERGTGLWPETVDAAVRIMN